MNETYCDKSYSYFCSIRPGCISVSQQRVHAKLASNSHLVSSRLVPQWTRPTFFRVSKLITFKVNLAQGPIPKLHFLPRNNVSFDVISLFRTEEIVKNLSRALENFDRSKKKKKKNQSDDNFPNFQTREKSVEARTSRWSIKERKKKKKIYTRAPILTFLETRSLNRIYAGWSSLYSRTIGGYRAASSMTHDLPILRSSFSSTQASLFLAFASAR